VTARDAYCFANRSTGCDLLIERMARHCYDRISFGSGLRKKC
jgi:hypothetical protein